MNKLSELKNQMAALDAEIEKALREEKPVAIAQAREIVKEFSLTADDIFGKPTSSRAPVAVKYRDPASGKTWTGRGKPPVWIANKDREAFAV